MADGRPGVLAIVSVLVIACANPDANSNDLMGYIDARVPPAAFCNGGMAYLNHYLERLFDFLEAAVPADFHVIIEIADDESCYSYSSCYSSEENTVYVSQIEQSTRQVSGTLRHELAHAVVDAVLGESVPFFEEGLAEAVSRESIASVPETVPGDMLDRPPLEIDYPTAARFVRFLIDTRGISRFMQLYRLNDTLSQSAIRASFLTVYGEDFDSIEAEYLSGDRRCGFLLGFCDPDGAETVQSTWSISLAASCLDPDFYGGAGTFGAIAATQRSLELSRSGLYRLRVESKELFLNGDGNNGVSQVTLLHCGGCDEQREWPLYVGEYEISLESGLYTFVIAPAGDSTMTLDLQFVGDPP